MTPTYWIGLMSGTSADGVDAVLVRQTGTRFEDVAHSYAPFSAMLRQAILSLCTPGPNEIERLLEVRRALTKPYTQVIDALLAKTGIAASQVRAIGLHGQTIRHRPTIKATLQIADPAQLAENTGIDVIFDFRAADCAAGGEGAPLVPRFHQARFGQDKRVGVLNLGGIANVTVLPGKLDREPLWGSDVGPANLLLDAWTQAHGKGDYDVDGAWAATGQIHESLLQSLLGHRFFAQPLPKSTGRELFNLAFLPPLAQELPPQDVARTLVRLTAASVAMALDKCALSRLFVCGGGALNRLMMQDIQALMPCPVVSTASVGTHPMWVEASAFAWLASAFVAGVPGNCPSATGATRPMILGALYPHTPAP